MEASLYQMLFHFDICFATTSTLKRFDDFSFSDRLCSVLNLDEKKGADDNNSRMNLHKSLNVRKTRKIVTNTTRSEIV